jgi:hypothetical protein
VERCWYSHVKTRIPGQTSCGCSDVSPWPRPRPARLVRSSEMSWTRCCVGGGRVSRQVGFGLARAQEGLPPLGSYLALRDGLLADMLVSTVSKIRLLRAIALESRGSPARVPSAEKGRNGNVCAEFRSQGHGPGGHSPPNLEDNRGPADPCTAESTALDDSEVKEAPCGPSGSNDGVRRHALRAATDYCYLR